MRDDLQKPTKICRQGHIVEGDNLRINGRGRHVCVECARAQHKAWLKANPARAKACKSDQARRDKAAGKMRYGYYQGGIKRSVTRDHVAQMIEAVHEHGEIRAAHSVIGRNKMKALIFFQPKVLAALHKAKNMFLKQRRYLFAAPSIAKIIVPRSPDSADRVMRLISDAMPAWMSRDHRDDVLSDMLEAWWSGRLPERDIPDAAKLFINNRFKIDHNKWGAASLDVPLSAETSKTLGDILPADRQLWFRPDDG